MKNRCTKYVSPILAATAMLGGSQVMAVNFEFGNTEIILDSQVSVGSSWRVEARDESLLDFDGNGTESTSDDGNRNYDKGDAFSQIFKGSHDLQIKHGNYGAFIRGKYWYDSAIENNSVEHGHVSSAMVVDGAAAGRPYEVVVYQPGKLDDSNYSDLAKGKGATLMDAFVYGDFEVADMPISVRLGRQVVSWGESVFIRGGVNAINAFDASAIRRPGVEVKEALLPSNMLYTNVGLTDDLSLEAFYLLEFQETNIDGCGTFFSTSDNTAEGCNFTTIHDSNNLSVARDETNGLRKASDDGQFGVALRYFAADLDTEFGLYAMNTHSQVPLFGITLDTLDEAALQGAVVQGVTDAVTASVMQQVADGDVAAADAAATIGAGVGATAPGAVAQAIGAARIGSSRYFNEYPEDIQLFGMSFATNVAGLAVSGEVSHKKDVPLQVNGPLTTRTALTNGVSGALYTGDASIAAQAAYDEVMGDNVNDGTGGDLQGYRKFDITQLQVSAVSTIFQVLGASRIAIVGEAGVSVIHDFDDVLRYGRSSIFGQAKFDGTDEGFVTETSWGYRARIIGTYSNVLPRLGLTPSISWSQDVSGYAAQPGGSFSEGAKKLGVSLKAIYNQDYGLMVAYQNLSGDDYSTNNDKDFVSLSLSASF